jgi:hypothetical protein
MRKSFTITLILAVTLASCFGDTRPYIPHKVVGYKPVYSTDSSLLHVQATGPQPVKFAGKIYVKGNLIFQNDLGSGVHVIDNTNPASAARIGFIRIIGNSEISIKGNYLYANSFTDLVVIDISNWQNVSEVKRMPNAFSQGSFIPLPEHGVYYECGQFYTNKFQTGWVKDSIYSSCGYYP